MINDLILKYLNECKSKKDLYKLPFKLIKNHKINYKCDKLKILILNTPCMGFGDLVFAWKLAKILRYYFKYKVDIATTQPEKMITLGENKDHLYRLATKIRQNYTSTMIQCRRYTKLNIFDLNDNEIKVNDYDIYIDAPIMADFEPFIDDIHKHINNATLFNTLFFSEYNDDIEKGFDFDMGVGKENDGILLLSKNLYEIETKKKIYDLLKIKSNEEFAFAYIANTENWEKCIKSFIEMIISKYFQNTFNKIFYIILPKFCAKYLYSKKNILSKIAHKKVSEIIFKYKDEEKMHNFKSKSGNKLYLLADIFPLSNKIMLSYMKYSVKDILVTGDQSISDVLSCCANKNVYYQIVDWKADFAENLADYLPNEYLYSTKTSCGTLKAIDYNSDYKKFINDFSFIKRSKNKLKLYFDTICALKNDKSLIEYKDYVLKKGMTLDKMKSIYLKN